MVKSPKSTFPQQSSPKATTKDWSYPITDMVAGGVQPFNRPQTSLNTSRLIKATAAITLASSLAGLVWGSHLAAQQLKTRLENKVEAALNRPVEWGPVRGVSPTGIRLGQTRVPAVAGNDTSIDIAAIDISFDWQSLLRRSTPRASVTLVEPRISVVQNSRGDWPALRRDEPLQPSSFSETSFSEHVSPETRGAELQRLRSVHIQDGTLTFATQQQYPRAVVPRAQVSIENVDGALTLAEAGGNPLLAFSLSGKIGAGGFQIEANTAPDSQLLQGHLRVYNLPAQGLNLLLPPDLGIESGVLNSNLSGTVAWQDRTAQDDIILNTSTLELNGSAIFKAGTVILGQLPEPVSNLRSSLWFQGKQVTLHNTGLQVGDLALSTEGTVDVLKGYNLLAQIPTIAATDIQALVGQSLPAPAQPTFQWQARVTGPLQAPLVETVAPPPLATQGSFTLDPELLGVSLGMGMANLPMRDRIPLIEGATYQFRGDGAWFTLTDGTVVPPLSRSAYGRGAAQLNSALSPTLDRKFYWLLQSSPYIAAIAADLGRGRLQEFLNGNTFDTDRFFLDYFLPIYRESSRAAGLDPGEALWMLDHGLRTLQDPLLRTPEAQPITQGAGTVGSFWQGEQLLSMQQLILRPRLVQPGKLGALVRFGLLRHLDQSTTLASRRLASTPEVMSKLPNVTFGAEEGAIAHALGVVQFQGPGIYSPRLRSLAERIVQNELAKQALRTTVTQPMQELSSAHTADLGQALANFSPQTWNDLGLGANLGLAEAHSLNGTNTLSVMVSRSEKAGYSLDQSYRNSRAILLELLQDQASLPHRQRLIFAVLKDHAFRPKFWEVLSSQLPHLSSNFDTIAAEANQYRQLATQGATLHEQFYAAMVEDGQDISVSAAIKHAVGFQAHLAGLIDQAFRPADPADPRYQAFRRSLAIYLRESPDISVYGGTEAALRLYGQETLNVQEMLAVDVAAAPRVRSLARLYDAAWQGGMIDQWDIPGFQRILLTGSLLAAGVERQQLPPDLAMVGFPSADFRRNLLFAVGPEGIKLEATRLGVQAHDHRVSFQPVAIPGYRAPSFEVADPNACPTQPEIQAIALGPDAEFVWYPTIQRVVLKRGQQECPIHDHWNTLFFDTLLETAPVVHSPAAAADLQAKLREAQLLEAGIFLGDL